jgi:Rrf2 family protein
MKISTRTRYGVRAMLEIANGGITKGVFQKDIALNQQLSNKYLDQIIHSLKTANLICDVRGKKSGYVLTREAKDITIYDIHRAFESEISFVDCMSGNFICERQGKCNARKFWSGLNTLVVAYFKSVTLEDMLNGKVGIDKFDFISEMQKM